MVNPNFFCKSLIGADAPNLRIPITVPAWSDILRPAEGGGLLHRDPRFYIRRQNLGFVLVALLIKRFHEGMLTTRAFTPSALSCS